MTILADYSKHLARLLPAVDTATFPPLLIAMLRNLAPFDDATILLYPGSELPVVEYFETPDQSSESTLDVFVKGAFLLDPYYLAATEHQQFGVFRLRDLAPSGFKDSQYYKTWYRSCGYQEEIGYLLPIGSEGFVNIALGKTAPRSRFSPRDKTIFEAILPVVETLCQLHWKHSASASSAGNLRKQLNSALQAFGSSLLTEREAQVINLVLHGHSTKTLAEKLSISMETVKLHRKHAYAKLEVTSQAELFYLFLDSVMSATNYQGGDTLVSYLQPPAT